MDTLLRFVGSRLPEHYPTGHHQSLIHHTNLAIINLQVTEFDNIPIRSVLITCSAQFCQGLQLQMTELECLSVLSLLLVTQSSIDLVNSVVQPDVHHQHITM